MNKQKILISAPVNTMSGYGYRSADIVRALIDLDKYDISVISMPWGTTPFGALKENNPRDKMILDRIISDITEQPDIFIQITVPNEFQPIGKYNIGITAGIETTLASAEWIEGCNRMDLILVSSNHSKKVFEQTQYTMQNKKTGQTGELKLTKPIEVLFEGFDPQTFKKVKVNDGKINDFLTNIYEKYCYLYVGHWLNGEIGQDRKNTGMLVKSFFETFYDIKNSPALVMKVSTGNYSISDRNRLIDKINDIQKLFKDKDKLPTVYLLHGDLTGKELNELYNHKKIKAMVSLTRGEGFGRPFLEFASIGKPIITSAWSGHMDFLNPNNHYLLPGKLTNVHPSVVWKGVIVKESQWFEADYNHFKQILWSSYKNYQAFKINSEKEYFRLRSDWSFNAMKNKINFIFNEKVPFFGNKKTLTLPDGI